MNRMSFGVSLAISILLSLPLSLAQQSSQTAAGIIVPRLIQFSGAINDAPGQPRSGVTGITFALYKDQAGGAALWLETQNVALDAQGRYTVLLGANSAEGMPVELFSGQWSALAGSAARGPGGAARAAGERALRAESGRRRDRRRHAGFFFCAGGAGGEFRLRQLRIANRRQRRQLSVCQLDCSGSYSASDLRHPSLQRGYLRRHRQLPVPVHRSHHGAELRPRSKPVPV